MKHKKLAYIFGSLDGDPANTCNWFHAKLQHRLAALLLTPALLGTPICSCKSSSNQYKLKKNRQNVITDRNIIEKVNKQLKVLKRHKATAKLQSKQ